MRPRLAAAAVACALAAPVVAVVPADAAPAPQYTANQGWKIFIEDRYKEREGSECTIGYNDHEDGVSYTAAHCGRDGEKVFLTDRAGNVYPHAAGVLRPSKKFDADQFSNDWAVIEWYDNVRLGPNGYGENFIRVEQVNIGEKICYHGYATHGAQAKASCGKLVGKIGSSFFFDAPVASDFGDSGGPVYVPGKGTVGVLSGLSWIPDANDNPLVGLERATTLGDGARLQNEQVARMLERYGRSMIPNLVVNPEDVEADVPGAEYGDSDPVQPPVKQRLPEEAGDAGKIAGIIVGIVAVLGILAAAAGAVLGGLR
ncbi:S1 family peptidase [Corynebacterium sp. TA-R-1]|uniref:S1 family peptidase n=1 Tax=Corynebacterium stercoris TaxID=2943490 RepID=A0ABT1FZJ9_9CORY|nr:S1 family peptidase [Corynebacterium stercoris]MCP1386855.1 S1 family peptidase [Corynebacterium stercoris]